MCGWRKLVASTTCGAHRCHRPSHRVGLVDPAHIGRFGCRRRDSLDGWLDGFDAGCRARRGLSGFAYPACKQRPRGSCSVGGARDADCQLPGRGRRYGSAVGEFRIQPLLVRRRFVGCCRRLRPLLEAVQQPAPGFRDALSICNGRFARGHRRHCSRPVAQHFRRYGGDRGSCHRSPSTSTGRIRLGRMGHVLRSRRSTSGATWRCRPLAASRDSHLGRSPAARRSCSR